MGRSGGFFGGPTKVTFHLSPESTKHRLVGKYTTLDGIYPGKDGDFQWRSVRLPEL